MCHACIELMSNWVFLSSGLVTLWVAEQPKYNKFGRVDKPKSNFLTWGKYN